MKLTEADAALYRLYAVGLLGYEEALKQAQSEFQLRRAMLQFDQTVNEKKVSDTIFRPAENVSDTISVISSRSPSADSRPAST